MIDIILRKLQASNADDLSKVNMQCKFTNQELAQKQKNDYVSQNG
jgi:hypothetical protein